MDALNERSRSVRGSRILMLGVAYKRDVSDVRESPCLDILALLLRRGARLEYNDPHVPRLSVDGRGFASVAVDRPRLRRAHCVVIGTDHSSYDWPSIVEEAQLVVDTRNATRGIDAPGKIVKL